MKNKTNAPESKLFRIIHLLILIVLYLPVKSQAQQMKYPVSEKILDFEILNKKFKNPDCQYGTIPFFVWNSKITKPEIKQKMQIF